MCAASSSPDLCPDEKHIPSFNAFTATVLPLDHQCAVVLDVDGLAEQRHAIAFGCHPLAQGDETAAPLLEWPPAAAERFLVKLLEVIAECRQDGLASDLLARENLEAGGDAIDLFVFPRVDVDVDAHADDRADAVGHVVDLDEDAGELQAIDEDVVRPLELGLDFLACGARYRLNGLGNRQGRYIGKRPQAL